MKPTEEELSKIKFTYMDKVLDSIEINPEKVREVTDLLILIKEELETKFSDDRNLVANGQLLNLPVGIVTMNKYECIKS